MKNRYITALQRFNVLRKIMILRKREQMYVGVTREGLPGAGLAPQSPKKQKRVIQNRMVNRGCAIFTPKSIKS